MSPKEIRNNKLRDAAFSLKESEVSEPFEVVLLERKPDGTVGSSTNSAWYIIKVDQVEASKLLPIDEARSEIERVIAKDLELNEQRQMAVSSKEGCFC